MPEEILNFEVNIYSDKDAVAHHNDFSVLSNLKRTKEYLCDIDKKYEHNSDLSVKCNTISTKKPTIHTDMRILHFMK